ncbi:MAG: MATE family efflux transporter [Qingshengfaniella sp.]
MSTSQSLPGHVKATALLALPLVGSQVAQFLIQLTDTLMMGWYGVPELAALVLANSVLLTVIVMGAGFGFAVMPLVAAAHETGEDGQIRRVTRMGLWASVGFAVLTMPVLLVFEPVFLAMGQDAQIARLGGEYLAVAGWGLIPALAATVLRSYLSALEHTRIVLLATLAAAAANIGLNWLLIFGHLGFPEMGVRGAALASVLMHMATFVLFAAYGLRKLPEHQIFARLWRPDGPALARVFRLGWPIAVTNLAEVGLFAFSSLMMGWVGVVALAAHGIALQLSAFIFMIHIGLSQAATVRVGRAYGRGDVLFLRRAAMAAMMISAMIALVTIIVFLTMPDPLFLGFLSADAPETAAILAVGRIFLAAAALFQVADAAQVLALGLLRGVQDTRRPMIYATVSYWLLGAPIAYVMAFPLGMGGVGIWVGLAVGLFCAAGTTMQRFWTGPARAPGPDHDPVS